MPHTKKDLTFLDWLAIIIILFVYNYVACAKPFGILSFVGLFIIIASIFYFANFRKLDAYAWTFFAVLAVYIATIFCVVATLVFGKFDWYPPN